jgi:hypothetical protein
VAALRSGLFKYGEDFFEGEDPGEDDHLYAELKPIRDEILDLADVLLEQRNTIPGAEMDWSTWDSYLRSIYQSSQALKRYVKGKMRLPPGLRAERVRSCRRPSRGDRGGAKPMVGPRMGW